MNIVAQVRNCWQRECFQNRFSGIMCWNFFSSIFRFRSAVTVSMISVIGMFLLAGPAYGLTIEPITWDVIGLDSNKVNTGPEHFPIGARVCNDSGSTATLTVTFDFNDVNDNYTGDPYINLRTGTLDEMTFVDVPNNTCIDAYFEGEVTRDDAAYDNTRGYTITAVNNADPADTASTPANRELYIEYLVSQSRNSVTDIQVSSDDVSYTSVPAGGAMTLVVGETYFIKLVASTATNGYEQIESFINFPNIIFQTLSVSTTYTADTSANVPNPDDKLYGDGCIWDNAIRDCTDTGKVGGDITVTYEVKILQVPGAPLVNPAPLSTLIYDFSGSSFHYNADYGLTTRFANIIVATAVNMGTVELVAMKVSDFLNNIGVSELNTAGMVDLLNAWNPKMAELLKDAERDKLLAAMTDYLDPDGDTFVVVLRWETLSERGTVGFYAERHQKGGWKRINMKMLPGLIAAPLGGQYWLADPGALLDDNYQYRLIEVEARGATREYGPFDLKAGNALK